jgi:hypothetical protein
MAMEEILLNGTDVEETLNAANDDANLLLEEYNLLYAE